MEIADKRNQSIDSNKRLLSLLVRALLGRAAVLNIIGKNKIALKDMVYGIKASEKLKDYKLLADCFLKLSYIHHSLNQYKDMFRTSTRAIHFYRKTRNYEGIANCYSNIGIVYHVKDEYAKSLFYHNKFLKINKT